MKSACGIDGWPFAVAEAGVARPDTLPDGRPWPQIRVLTVSGGGDAAPAAASVARQGYPEHRHDIVAPGMERDALAGILADAATDAVLLLPAGDLLAPGALVALALELALSGAAAVAGLRVLYTDHVTGLDVPSLTGTETGAEGPCGEVLWSRDALARFALRRFPDPAETWATLPASARRRIGRPVLLKRGRPATRNDALSIVSLTGTGTVGGAGVAHRRLSDALALAGHAVTPVILGQRPMAAEWTDRFPQAEAEIDAADPDFVLVGNVHGATRSLDAVGRIAAKRPTALVLHDLFALTGRCCHPRDCTKAERGCDSACPGPDEYPQLSPRRIAGMHARKRDVLAAPSGPILLANSAWTQGRSEALAPAGAETRPVSLAFPTGIFRPGDRGALRRRLGLPGADVLILVSSVIVDGPDKGFSDLRDALQAVAGPGVGVVAIGRLDDPGRFGIANLHAPGLIGSEEELGAWYGACDLHVTASRHETLGQTPIEAGLCGVPTLAYRTSGLTTSVIDGVSGRLVDCDPASLAAALRDLVADGAARGRLGAFARISLESRFSPASAALSVDAVLRERGLLPDTAARPGFAPDLLGHFPFAAERLPGAEGTVQAPSSPVVRRLRRTKQAVLGRRMPLFVRRCLYLADALRGSAAR
ncbi:glycosyltransferase [Methylobacterium aerolatum]|uniref:Glycosyltransferase involved in cell wall biosynthesis n=1 Tax=Methylobacterium aerolatum TaxID=418708 RepID=A0ABU0HU35_9HYPH|nr:glycosyltransferase [Methylobacterium aerolatum]MDQ0445839.1 glycosyltransferase involved in cell wall biosynthesis [Methylobacterium aerolatum]GJD35900.1 D-inositol-3-phosphate glycosyltransferase [Methylobacterium aerolatum]